MKSKIAFVLTLLFSASLCASAKCTFSVLPASGDTLPTIAYLNPGESLHLVISYDNEIDCDILVDDFTIYKDSDLFEDFPLQNGTSASFDVYLTGAATIPDIFIIPIRTEALVNCFLLCN